MYTYASDRPAIEYKYGIIILLYLKKYKIYKKNFLHFFFVFVFVSRFFFVINNIIYTKAHNTIVVSNIIFFCLVINSIWIIFIIESQQIQLIFLLFIQFLHHFFLQYLYIIHGIYLYSYVNNIIRSRNKKKV